MKNVVATFATLCLLALVSVQTAFGEMLPPEEGAVPLGTFITAVGAEDMTPSLKFSHPGNKFGVTDNATATIATTAWMVSSGETVYTLDVNTAEFYMPCGWAKQLALTSMMDMFAQAAIKTGTELGYTYCGTDCGNNITSVYYASCVKRENGQECPSLVAAPGSSYSINAYDVCCASGTPLITLLYTVCGADECSGDYEPTC